MTYCTNNERTIITLNIHRAEITSGGLLRNGQGFYPYWPNWLSSGFRNHRDKLTTHRARMKKQEVLEILGFSHGRLTMTRTSIGGYVMQRVTSSMTRSKAETGSRRVSVNQSPLSHTQQVERLLIPRKAKYWRWRFDAANWAWWSEWKCPPSVHRDWH